MYFIIFVLLTNICSCDIIHSMAVTKRSEGYPSTEKRRMVQAVGRFLQKTIASEPEMRNNSSVSRVCPVSAKELSDSRGGRNTDFCNLSGTAEKFFPSQSFSLGRFIFFIT